jgi:DNA-binding MarR family transcriptional regulator
MDKAGTASAAGESMQLTRPQNSASAEVHAIAEAFRDLERSIRLTEVAGRKQLGVSAAQLLILEALSARPGLSINELAAVSRTHQSSVSGVVSGLKESGYIDVRRGHDDHRIVRLRLTTRGRRVIERAHGVPINPTRDGIQRLTPLQRTQLLDSLTTLLTAMSTARDESPGQRKRKSR